MSDTGALHESWATLWEAIADAQPDALAVVIGTQEMTWREYDDRAARLAGAFTAAGVGRGTKVAQLMFNCPEYMESVYAAFKVQASPVNVNYRYQAAEIAYVCDNAGAEVLVFHGAHADRVATARADGLMPSVRLLLQVDDGHSLIDGARWYHEVIAEAEPAPRIDRSGGDELLLYTGGTTGMPKGVIWPHHELFGALAFPGYMAAGLDVPTTIDAVAGTAAAIRGSGHSPVMLCAPPLMHGTALFLAMSAFVMGGTVVLLGGRSFDADELWDLVERYQVTQISLVGDAFARPMTAALAARAEAGSPRNLASLQRIASTGATLSADQKRALAAHAPNLMILDMIGASEGGPFGVSATMPGDEPTDTAVFTAPPNVVTLDPDTHEVIPRGSDTPGMLAVSGPMPAGYLGDPDKTARTFPVIDGVRYTVPGDFATIATDGTVTLLGRGSVCINSGGEKIYPEEVEVAAREHPDVIDAIAVGVPHERFGQTVTLVCSTRSPVDPDAIIDTVKERIAHYKAPRQIVFVDEVYRAPNGKLDYRWATDTAIAALAGS